jgi:cysteine desulfurase
MANSVQAEVHLVGHDEKGKVDLENLEQALSAHGPALVSLAHANNETGNLLPVKDVVGICRAHKSVLHMDMVQSIGHFPVDLQALGVDLASFSAHKFHGPKGAGGLFVNLEKIKAVPMLWGGAQEQNMRGGTENIAAVAGMAKALELFHRNYGEDKAHISRLKEALATGIEKTVPQARFVGQSRDRGLYSILNVLFPKHGPGEMILYMLDMEGISASAGAACSSGTVNESHVARALGLSGKGHAVRFSFSRFNTKKELDYCTEKINKLFSGEH